MSICFLISFNIRRRTIDPSKVFSTLHMHQTAKIRRHYCKNKLLKSSKLNKFESDTLKRARITVHHTNVCKISRLSSLVFNKSPSNLEFYKFKGALSSWADGFSQTCPCPRFLCFPQLTPSSMVARAAKQERPKKESKRSNNSPHKTSLKELDEVFCLWTVAIKGMKHT